MKFLILLFCFCSLQIVKTPSASNMPHKVSVLDSLKKKAKEIDQYVYKHQKELLVFAKVPGKSKLVRVIKENWPDATEYTYNILKDSTGHIIMIAQMPYSESGDWYIEYKNYFDNNGKTFCFSKRETVFDDSVKGGIAMEQLFNYYDLNFNLLGKIDKLTDKDEKTIKRKKTDFDFPGYKYSIYKNLHECLVNYQIQSSALK